MVMAVAGFLMAGLASGYAQAAEFRSVGAEPAILFDAPTEKGRKLFIGPRGMPLELVLSYGEWVKVRDVAGDLSWVQAKSLVPKRQLIVNVASAKVHAAADAASPLVFTAARNVLLELAEPMTSGWIKVRHSDGQSGFVKAGEVWGE